MRKIVLLSLLLLALLALPGIVSADYSTNPNYTPIFPYTNDHAYINQSFILNHSTATPSWIFLIYLITGFGTLIASLILTPAQRNDVFAYIAPLPLLIAALTCTGLSGIEMVTGYGVAGVTETKGTSSFESDFVLLENHTIYINDVLAVFLMIVFILALLNCFRAYAEYQIFKANTAPAASGGIDNE